MGGFIPLVVRGSIDPVLGRAPVWKLGVYTNELVSLVQDVHLWEGQTDRILARWQESRFWKPDEHIETALAEQRRRGEIETVREPPPRWEGYYRAHCAQHAHLAPQGYGLVVVDFATNYIHSMQDYTDLGCMFGVSIRLFAKGFLERMKASADVRTCRGDLGYAFEACVINGRVRFVKSHMLGEPERVCQTSLLEELKYLFDHEDNGMCSYHLDMSPFLHVRYNRREFDQLKAALLEADFKLTQAEEDLWEEWGRAMRRADEEDEEGEG